MALVPRSPADVVELLEQANLTAQGGILAFDADGTLWSGDLGIDLFEAFLAARAARPAALAALQAEARAIGERVCDDANDQAKVLYAAFESAALPEERAFAMMAWAFAGYTPADVDAFARDVLSRCGLAARLQTELAPVFAWAGARGVECWVVSASPRAIVSQAVTLVGIDPARVVAMTPRVEGGLVVPAVTQPAPYAAGKAAALALAAPGRRLVGAFGDSAYDLELVAPAAVAVAVRPKPAMRANASAVPHLVELIAPS